MANAQVGSGHGTATKAKHMLRRYHSFMQRVAMGEVVLKHIPDKQNPADFLTKWVPGDKFKMSVDYLTNSRAWDGNITNRKNWKGVEPIPDT